MMGWRSIIPKFRPNVTLVGVSESCRASSLATLEPRYLEPSGLDQVPEF